MILRIQSHPSRITNFSFLDSSIQIRFHIRLTFQQFLSRQNKIFSYHRDYFIDVNKIFEIIEIMLFKGVIRIVFLFTIKDQHRKFIVQIRHNHLLKIVQRQNRISPYHRDYFIDVDRIVLRSSKSCSIQRDHQDRFSSYDQRSKVVQIRYNYSKIEQNLSLSSRLFYRLLIESFLHLRSKINIECRPDSSQILENCSKIGFGRRELPFLFLLPFKEIV